MVTCPVANFWTITISEILKKSINYNNAVCCKKIIYVFCTEHAVTHFF